MDETPFEVDDLVVRAHPLFDGRELLDPLDEQAPVPTPVEHAHPALPGDLAPEPPQEVVAELTLVRFGVRVHRVVPGVERLDHTPHRTTLAGCVDALDHDEETRADGPVVGLTTEMEAQFEELLLGGFEPFAVVAVGQPRRQVEVVESSHAASNDRQRNHRTNESAPARTRPVR